MLIGEGVDYDLEGQDPSAQELRGDMRAFVGAANRANLTIYPFDPRVYTHLGDDFVDIASTPPGWLTKRPSTRSLTNCFARQISWQRPLRTWAFRGIALHATNMDAIPVNSTHETAGAVTLDVFDLAGRQVARLLDGERPAGEHAVEWDAGAAPAGVYYVRLATAGRTVATRCVKLR